MTRGPVPRSDRDSANSRIRTSNLFRMSRWSRNGRSKKLSCLPASRLQRTGKTWPTPTHAMEATLPAQLLDDPVLRRFRGALDEASRPADLRRFLAQAYDLKSVADYATGPEAVVRLDRAAAATGTPRRFLGCCRAVGRYAARRRVR